MFPPGTIHAKTKEIVMSRQTRRTFLRKSAAAGVAFSTFTISGTKSSGRVIGANDTIRAAICGLRGRGSRLICTGGDFVIARRLSGECREELLNRFAAAIGADHGCRPVL